MRISVIIISFVQILVMDCKELLNKDLDQVVLPEVESILVIAEPRRVNWVISRLKIKNKDQHFVSMGYEERDVRGFFDIAVYDGGEDSTWIDAMGLLANLYPYLKRNVKEFYVISN